jgi:hypothetical protein
MKKFVIAAVATFALVGLVMAEEFNLQIAKISSDGKSVTGFKAKGFGGGGGKGGGKGGFGGGFGGGPKGEEVTVKVAPGVKVYKGKFDPDNMGFVADGDDLKLDGLMAALKEMPPASVTVGANKLAASDKLELSMKDGHLMAKLNGKDVDIDSVTLTPTGTVNTRVTTDDAGVITSILTIQGFGKKKGGN